MRTAFLAAAAATVSLAAMAPGVAQAACQNTYTGANGGEWATPANWSTNGVPTNSQDVCVPTGKTVTIIENGVAVANTLTIDAGATLRLRTDPGFFATQATFGDVDNSGLIEFTATGTAADGDFTIFTINAGKKLT